MEAYRLYYDEDKPWSLVRLGTKYHVAHETVRKWITSLGGTIRPPSINNAMINSARELAKREAKLEPGEAICHCGLIYFGDGSGQCPTCNGDTERETEREAELALFSSAAFLDNPRNIGRFDPKKVDSVRGVRAVW